MRIFSSNRSQVDRTGVERLARTGGVEAASQHQRPPVGGAQGALEAAVAEMACVQVGELAAR
jgi:hypothetical protein